MFTLIASQAALATALNLTSLNNQYTCFKENFQLQIKVLENASQPLLMWTVTDQSNQSLLLEGQGPLTRENETEFSSFDEGTAVAYKPKKAVVVLPDNSAVLFDCSEQPNTISIHSDLN